MQHGYSIRLSRDDWDSPEVRFAWTRLIAGASDGERLGKSPEFIDHLRSTHNSSQLYLATIRDPVGSICGVVPLCIARSGLRFKISGNILAESRSHAVRILGGVPHLPADPVAHDLLFALLDQEFSGCQVISMESVPMGSFLWHHVHDSKFLNAKFIPYVMHGVRMCHVIPVPPTVEAYFANFSAKRRYNVKRHARILRDHFGGRLELQSFTSPHQIDDLFNLITPKGEFAGLKKWGESKALTIDRRDVESLASRGLLLIYLLIGAGRPCAALMGLKYQGVFHVDAIPRDRSLDRFSPGSTAVHLAIEDLIRKTSIRKIDMGFGSPAYPYSATNVTEPRASLVLFRKTLSNRLLRLTHATFESLIDLANACVRTRPHRGQLRTQSSTTTAISSTAGQEISSHATIVPAGDELPRSASAVWQRASRPGVR
jgi:CelD/BcsL family acetyltransferase involved in cellulose biosynthesis